MAWPLSIPGRCPHRVEQVSSRSEVVPGRGDSRRSYCAPRWRLHVLTLLVACPARRRRCNCRWSGFTECSPQLPHEICCTSAGLGEGPKYPEWRPAKGWMGVLVLSPQKSTGAFPARGHEDPLGLRGSGSAIACTKISARVRSRARIRVAFVLTGAWRQRPVPALVGAGEPCRLQAAVVRRPKLLVPAPSGR